MERQILEDRIRASLESRATDVEPTPLLWDRVAERTTRRNRFRLGAWALSGVAVVAVLVFGGTFLLQRGPTSIDIQDDIATAPPSEPAVPGAPTTRDTVVTTDGAELFEVDPTSGEVVRRLPAFDDFAEGHAVADVAVRPTSDDGSLTVATVVGIEGAWQVELSTFAADGTRTDRVRIDEAPDGQAFPDDPSAPSLVWSDDGRYLLWAGTLDGTAVVHGYDLVADPRGEQGIMGEPTVAVAVTEGGGIPADLDLQTWDGPTDGTSTLTGIVGGLQAVSMELVLDPGACREADCPDTVYAAAVSDLGFEGGAPVALGSLSDGTRLALLAGGDGTQDAEGIAWRLLANPMGDDQRELELPDLGATAAPQGAWMDVTDGRVVVGLRGQSAWMLSLAGGPGALAVDDVVGLPDGTTRAGVSLVERVSEVATPTEAPPSDEPATETPTEVAPEAGTLPTTSDVLGDGLPRYVVESFASAQELRLVDRTDPQSSVASWGRPEGVLFEDTLGEVAVWPGSTPDHLEAVIAWNGAGESGPLLSRLVVDGGEVVANELLPDALQPRGPGFAAGPIANAVFDPSGRWLAYVEAGEATPSALRVVGWVDGAPTEAVLAADLDQVTTLAGLDDWAVPLDADAGQAVLTARPADPEDTTLVELTLRVTDSGVAFADDPAVVDLPGPALTTGSFAFEDGSTRYVVLDDDVVRYGLLDALDVSVPTGLDGPEAGEVVTFGPDRAVVRLADGGWQVVQVDDGATSTVDVPGGTVAFLPFPDPRG